MAVDPTNVTALAGTGGARLKVAGAIKQAADATGTSFEYLLATAKMESDFNPTAGASTSSAHGLYQFIDQTWFGTVKEAGSQVGYGQYADAITKTSQGDYTVSDPTARQAILKLRDDPNAASAMAAALTQSNSFKLPGKIGRRPSDGELYMAHFLGVGGAARLISSAEDSPNASAARMFPNAAAANHSIFYDRQGSARSVSEVYGVLNARYAGAATSQVTRTALAAYGAEPASTQVAGAAAPSAPRAVDNAAYLASFPDVRSAAAPTVASAAAPNRQTASSDVMFRSLFQVDERSQPVSSTVHELWGKSTSLTSVASTQATAQSNGTAPASAPAPFGLGLFSDPDGTFSG
jgi:Transglycosylase SLT domain